MPLTDFQRRICRLIARSRRASGESYVAGGAALNELVAAPRVSDDIDLFHDTEEAVGVAWDADRLLLTQAGITVTSIRERPGFVEALASSGFDRVLLQWTRDSAFRFFPLVEHDDFGLALHPFDLATNKLLALVGRVEVRDWIDTLTCHEAVQPLGYLAWAASGKNAGFSPYAILEEAARGNRYSETEVAALQFGGPKPDAAALSRTWRRALTEGRAIVDQLPSAHVGACVLAREDVLFRGGVDALVRAMADAAIRFRTGSLRAAFPTLR